LLGRRRSVAVPKDCPQNVGCAGGRRGLGVDACPAYPAGGTPSDARWWDARL